MPARVLVTDVQERSALAACRSLARAGYEVTGVATSRLAPGLASRACTARFVLADPCVDLESYIAGLADIVGHRPHDVLLPGTDAALMAVSGRREQLEPHVRLGLPTRQVVAQALDKRYLGEQAALRGLSPPPSVLCSGREQAIEAARAMGFPVLVKPVETVVEGDGVADRWASRIASDERAVAAALQCFGSAIVQRRLTGTIVSFAGVATTTGLLASAVSRYRRTWPVDAGSVCFSETVAAPPALAERVEGLMHDIGWEGVFELELIDPGDGALAAIDLNPRVHGSLSLAVAAGAPLPVTWCQWLTGRNPRRVAARPGVRYRWADADMRHLLWQARRGAYSLAAAGLVPRRRVAHPFFEARDPGPGAARALQGVGQVVRRLRRPGPPGTGGLLASALGYGLA